MPSAPMAELYLVAINLTYRCNLHCDHCYMDAAERNSHRPDELTTQQVEQLLEQLAAHNPPPMVVLTGGEPLLRRDLEQLVQHGQQLGLMMVIGTNGVLLNEARVLSLKAAGAMGLGISLDSLDPERHDRFRRAPGSWQRTMEGIEWCRHHQLPFQIHLSITEHNVDEVAAMIDFCAAIGARVLNCFFLVCTGRGQTMTDISAEHYEQVLTQLATAQQHHPELLIRARCAPHFQRIARQLQPDAQLTATSGLEGSSCLAGSHYCRITPTGELTACPYIPDSEGNITTTPFWTLWRDAPTFKALRHPQLQGRCGLCEYRQLCGGCRARPIALARAVSPTPIPLDQQLMQSDPLCHYLPQGGRPLRLPSAAATAPHWSPEALQRLQRVPPFLRTMVKRRAEAYVTELGAAQITPDHLATLARRRFGDQTPSFQGPATKGNE